MIAGTTHETADASGAEDTCGHLSPIHPKEETKLRFGRARWFLRRRHAWEESYSGPLVLCAEKLELKAGRARPTRTYKATVYILMSRTLPFGSRSPPTKFRFQEERKDNNDTLGDGWGVFISKRSEKKGRAG